MLKFKPLLWLITMYATVDFGLAQTYVTYRVNGRAWVSSSRSQGILNGTTINDSAHPLVNDILLFVLHTDTVSVQTRAEGYFTTPLKAGNYSILKRDALRRKTSVLRIEPSFLMVNGPKDSLRVLVHYHVNGR
jgi:hypothetical protein